MIFGIIWVVILNKTNPGIRLRWPDLLQNLSPDGWLVQYQLLEFPGRKPNRQTGRYKLNRLQSADKDNH